LCGEMALSPGLVALPLVDEDSLHRDWMPILARLTGKNNRTHLVGFYRSPASIRGTWTGFSIDGICQN
jgi:hypothetical protein